MIPFGVSKDFLDLAKQGQRRALIGLAPLLLAGLAGGLVAELLDVGRMGGFVLLYIGALAGGLLAGSIAGWSQTQSWGESLKNGWSAWMHAAVGAGSMGEVAHRTGATRIPAAALVSAALAALNAACLIAAWFQLPALDLTDPFGAFAIVTVTLTGLTVGMRGPVILLEGWWCREVEQQTLQLVEEGRVGVWGIR